VALRAAAADKVDQQEAEQQAQSRGITVVLVVATMLAVAAVLVRLAALTELPLEVTVFHRPLLVLLLLAVVAVLEETPLAVLVPLEMVAVAAVAPLVRQTLVVVEGQTWVLVVALAARA
jgi:hypothetical protein